jgi:hypothetical protein
MADVSLRDAMFSYLQLGLSFPSTPLLLVRGKGFKIDNMMQPALTETDVGVVFDHNVCVLPSV